jgi:hypothetical protein
LKIVKTINSNYIQTNRFGNIDLLCRPTVCVSRWWAGWDSAGEQKKPEAMKMLENGAESHQSAGRVKG